MGLFGKTRKSDGRLAVTFLDDGICAASVRRLSGARPVVERSVFFPASPSLSVDALERFGREVGVAQYQCGTLLAAGEYQLLALDAPNVPRDELKTAVRWRLKDMIDFHIDDATIDVLDIPGDKDATVRSHAMFAVAARNSLIEQRQGLFSAAKVKLTVIDIPEMAQRNLSAVLEPEGRGLAMLSIGADGGLLTVTFHGELYLARRIDVRLAQLLDGDAERRQQIHEKIALELQRSLDHFDRQFHFVAVAKLLLAPLPACGLLDYLSANLYTKVEALDLADALDLSRVPALADAAEQQRCFLTLGAALRREEVVL